MHWANLLSEMKGFSGTHKYARNDKQMMNYPITALSLTGNEAEVKEKEGFTPNCPDKYRSPLQFAVSSQLSL